MRYCFTIGSCLLIMLCSCGSEFVDRTPRPNFNDKKGYLLPEINGPVLSGEQTIKKLRLAAGYELTLVSEEPDVINPVVMRFDHLGRLWVVEMIAYMNDIKGLTELEKLGRISILEDTTGDGKMDKSTVFMDKLVEPRAIAFHRNGILWADNHVLYHTEVINDYSPGKTTIVDKKYALGNSVEHKSNGLVRAIDNWYYSARSVLRYKQVKGKWLIERTEFRGQFGISADNHGRLYHGQQNTLMRADIFAPNFFIRHPGFNVKVGGLATQNNKIQGNCFNVKAHEQAVYPVRKNFDMRDGYTPAKQGHVDENRFAYRCTAACGHFFYRDDYFPEGFDGIIPDPAVHIVKVLSVKRKNGIPFGEDKFPFEELIASPDTRFRPVDIQSGPDGTVYIADMYHGILQHKIYMNSHLTKLINEQKLDGPNGLGRIYRLTLKGKAPKKWKPLAKPSLQELVDSLASKSPWRRDHAQRLLVDQSLPKTKAVLEKFLNSTHSTLGKMHALWTLEGIGAIEEAHILKALQSKEQDLHIHASRISWQLKDSKALMRALIKAIPKSFSESTYYVVQRLSHFKDLKAQSAVASAYQKWADQPYFKQAIISGGGEYLQHWMARLPDGTNKIQILNVFLNSTKLKVNTKVNLKGIDLQRHRNGEKIYSQNCFACHGYDGKGLREMGPPLMKSEWVIADPERLAKILLKGMQGELTVNGKKYKPTASMPGLEGVMNDRQISDVMTYIRNAWGNKSSAVRARLVRQTREKIKGQIGPYKESDLRHK
jgi:mono/diheme cytochrome c family protein